MQPLELIPSLSTNNADPRWEAVLARDRRADGQFVFSVSTTGVYCRPSCGARRPRPEHVRFHGTAAAAQAAGFRPCRRCRPDLPPQGAPHAAAIAAACRRLAALEPPPLAILARAAGLSPFHFHRRFKAATGLTPRQFAAAHREQRLRRSLTAASSVTEAIYAAGYNSSGRFYASAREMLGMVPACFRAGGEHEVIRYACGHGPLGTVLAARSRGGLCAILLGDDPVTLAADLARQFPRARLEPAGAGFERSLARVLALVSKPDGDTSSLDLPLDIRGTLFQRRVWQALRRIPPGATVTYGTLARRLGAPGAARAVARACAANPLAVAIPCHRVLRADGVPTRYRWGTARKQALLRREAP